MLLKKETVSVWSCAFCSCIKALLVFFISLLAGCHSGSRQYSKLNFADALALTEQVRQHFVPDKRIGWFQADTLRRNDSLFIRLETNMPQATDSLTKVLPSYIYPEVEVLPSPDLGNQTRAIVSISVANLRSEPRHVAELATQALLGTPLKVWKKKSGWLLVQTPDQYLAWVDQGAVSLMSPEELTNWMAQPQLIFTQLYGQAYTRPDRNSEQISDLVAGNVLRLKERQGDFFSVLFPDGRETFVLADACSLLEQWQRNTSPDGAQLVKTARSLMGVPYLWGGTSTKGVDCSGFTKIAYFMNGLLIPRDASQQVHTGTLVDTSKGFENLQPGDLLFFGQHATDSTKERVVHVGMWMGQGEFIHASGKVRIGSLNPQAPHYDAFEHKRFLRAKRITGTNSSIYKVAPANLYYGRQADAIQ